MNAVNKLLSFRSSLLSSILVVLSLTAALLYCAKRESLLYGDAVAHINIARRVVDNRHPWESFGQLGTVWLPLQHIAMVPFVWNNTLWRNGFAGAIPSMLAYVLGALGIFRLVNARAPRTVAYLATGIYAFNPNLLYMQSTAMNEPIFLAFFMWTLVYLDRFLVRCFPNPTTPVAFEQVRPTASLEACGITLAGGAFTRYDGWFVGIIVGAIVLFAVAIWRRGRLDATQRRVMGRSLFDFLLLNALVPTFWLTYNHCLSGNALDFVNGPYSAKAIAIRTTPRGAPAYPGQKHFFMAALYFLKSAKLNMGPGAWGATLFSAALLGTGVALWRFRSCAVFLLLWLPVPFYALSVAYGSVPIFLPVWYPYSFYNVRYGLELLPVFAVFIALITGFILQLNNGAKFKTGTCLTVLAIVTPAYLFAYRQTPITLREAQVNSPDRPMESQLGRYLAALPDPNTLLMYTADHVGALQQGGIPLRKVISEASHPDWEEALMDLPGHADYVVACQGDPVSTAMRQQHLELAELMSFGGRWQSSCAVYGKEMIGASAQYVPRTVESQHENRR